MKIPDDIHISDEASNSVNPSTTEKVDRSARREIVIIVLVVSAWSILFAAGVVVNSAPYRDRLGSAMYLPLLYKLYYWSIFLTTYPLTNIALLSCLAAMAGAAGHVLKVDLSGEAKMRNHSRNPHAAAIVGGFFVYLISISGVLALVQQPFDLPSPSQYVRLAGFISLLSFLTGYNPQIFNRLLHRVSELIEGRGKRE